MGWYPKMDQKIYEAFESALTKDLEQIIIVILQIQKV